MFCGCSSLSSIQPLEHWNVSNVQAMSEMFGGCSSLSSIQPLEHWNII